MSKKNHDSEQAEQISAWIEKEEDNGYAWVAILNTSNFPIYKVILSTVNIQGIASSGKETPNELRTFIDLIPPGKYYSGIVIHHGMNFISGIELAFQDLNSNCWIITGDGKLTSISLSTYKYYDLDLPISWEQPKKLI